MHACPDPHQRSLISSASGHVRSSAPTTPWEVADSSRGQKIVVDVFHVLVCLVPGPSRSSCKPLAQTLVPHRATCANPKLCQSSVYFVAEASHLGNFTISRPDADMTLMVHNAKCDPLLSSWSTPRHLLIVKVPEHVDPGGHFHIRSPV